MFELLVFVITVLLIYIFKRESHKRKNLPPGPIRWPIVGSIPQMLMIHPVHGHLQLTELGKKYNGIMSFGFGVHYAIAVSKYEILKDLFRRPETCLERFRFEYFEQRNNFKNLGVIWSYGDVWKEQRKYTVKLLRQFGFGKKQTMDETIQVEVNDLISDIQKEVNSSWGTWSVDINRLSACTINIVWASIGGYRFDPNSPEIQRHLKLNNEIFESLGPRNMLGAFPFLKIFPTLFGFRRQYEIQRKCRDFMVELIEDAKERRRGCVEPESFVEVYLDEIEKNKSNKNSNMTDEQLVLILMDLFLGGSDTTSALINWIILHLALNQNVQNKARSEMNQFCQPGFIPIPSNLLNSMPYTYAIILETMRSSQYMPIPSPRRVTEDIECAGYKIPAGTCLFPNYYPIFLDKDFWGDPQEFRPERLLLPNGKLNPVKVERIVQFGIGARSCPGENMAMISTFMIITGLLTNFSLEIIPGREPSLEPGKSSLTMKPDPFVLKVKNLLD